ncbi:MAG: shikimate dehydrogenase family protein [Bacteroidales bacterium]
MKDYGLIGYPLGHSFSVAYFSEKFAREGIDASYRNFPLRRIAEFDMLIKQEPDLYGLNVTVPYKQAVIPYLDALSHTARAVQAVNTICFCRKSEHRAMTGHNTDVIGFEKSLRKHLKKHHTSALILGTGGSASAVGFVLANLGIEYKKVSRKAGEGRLGYGDLDVDTVNRSTLIINCTPLGMHPDTDACPDLPYEALTRKHLLFDLIYNPGKTMFLSRGEAQGAAITNGYDMLVYQAEAAWEIWNRKK